MNSRIPAILDRVSPEDVVLDVGCVQHSVENENNENWLHKRLSDICREVVGIDVLEEDIRILQERGYTVKHQNAEQFGLDRDFDVIVAGELIEHLANPGKFLDCARAHLKPDGRLLLTTPNPWAVSRF
ncbi:class I SAM-dependent methyltransferase [Halorientalis brevis]|uniref:Class I SAM-dependent methyltransferase n=1 Tax=Halorientalis brevis TaxID=1126241 RepID=A0ABD6C776_9EURY|nr:methyltransferase domain-containing protein [Halorientalis brevis]